MDNKTYEGLTKVGEMILHLRGQGFSFEEAVKVLELTIDLEIKRVKVFGDSAKNLAEQIEKLKANITPPPPTQEPS